MKSRMASAISSVMAGNAMSKSRPMLPLDPVLLDSLLLEPLDAPVAGVPVVGISDEFAADMSAAAPERAESIMGRTLRFNRADSFWRPNRMLE